MDAEIRNAIRNLLPEMMEMADEIFDHPEQSLEEHYASDLLCIWLEKHGYAVERGMGGMETAFRAEYSNGNGGVSIGLLAEYDALPMGHACGHHLQGPIMLAVAETLKNHIKEAPYKIVIYGTPAEEGFKGKGKVKMIENGCFRDIDVALMVHAGPNSTVDVKSLAITGYDVTFRGKAAHEALTPEQVRNGLDAVNLAVAATSMLRLHATDDVRVQYGIKDCGGMPGNQDNSTAVATFKLRTYIQESMPGLEQRLKDIFRGAALMTGTEAKIVKTSSLKGKMPSYSLNDIIMEHALELDSPDILPKREKTGSTDFAEVTHILPGAVYRFKLVPLGTSSHSSAFLEYGKGSYAESGMENAIQVMYLTCEELICVPEAMAKVREEFIKRKTLGNQAEN